MLTALETIGRRLPKQGIVNSFRMECRKQQNYDVHLIEGLLSPEYSVLPAMLQERKAHVVTTSTVYGHYGELLSGLIRNRGLNVQVVVLPGGETNKTLRSVERICAAALEYKLDRRSLLIGLGGGVCTDVVAMATSAIRRGIDHLRIPTTLIGLIDAGIGLKSGVNLGKKKNYFGCFNPPTRCWTALFWRSCRRRFCSTGWLKFSRWHLLPIGTSSSYANLLSNSLDQKQVWRARGSRPRDYLALESLDAGRATEKSIRKSICISVSWI
ncbi:3-dehydroquinate synthase AroB or putative 2-epi-5-epi-valiolone synthase newone [Candidatus Burkholderia humilis]|nr:3-dehydroquinate synthase AroB or putative 2-epi-5-epi-valiolone synthase newone [Candidatus Burkholderia humilis]